MESVDLNYITNDSCLGCYLLTKDFCFVGIVCLITNHFGFPSGLFIWAPRGLSDRWAEFFFVGVDLMLISKTYPGQRLSGH